MEQETILILTQMEDTVSDTNEGISDTDSDGFADFVDRDSDNDGLADQYEFNCANLSKHSRIYADVDQDGYSDLAENAVGSDPCDDSEGVTDIVDFYFELPHGAPEKTDILNFTPTVQKTDIFFNVDTTGSMGDEINELKTGLSAIITQVKNRISDSAFGVAEFEDYPVYPHGAEYMEDAYYYYIFHDKPFTLLQSPTTNESTAQTGVDSLTLDYGGDFPEAGFESLYQIGAGSGTSWTGNSGNANGVYYEWNAGTVPAYTGTGIGGVGFREASLPIILHITDAISNTPTGIYYDGEDFLGYNSNPNATISNSHTRNDAINTLNNIGARVITFKTTGAAQATIEAQLDDISNNTGAVVPVCAFQTESSWRCGDSKCCTGLSGAAIDPTSGQCTLRYELANNGTGLGVSVVDGIDAVVKYATFNVYTNPQDDGNSGTIDTKCFLKKIESLQFIAPPAEPEASCTPVATPAIFNGATYNNGFNSFASGTSSSANKGSTLQFTVHAENDTCFEPTSAEAQVFTAFIQVVDNTTGAILDTQEVTIIVPGIIEGGCGSEGC